MPNGLLRDISLRLQSTFSVATKCKGIEFSLLRKQNKTIQVFKKKILKEKKEGKDKQILSVCSFFFWWGGLSPSSAALQTRGLEFGPQLLCGNASCRAVHLQSQLRGGRDRCICG